MEKRGAGLVEVENRGSSPGGPGAAVFLPEVPGTQQSAAATSAGNHALTEYKTPTDKSLKESSV